MSSLVLSDGDQQQEFISATGSGIWLDKDGLNLPLATFEHTYAEAPNVEGKRRTNSRASGAEGSFKLIIANDDETDFWDDVDWLQQLVVSAHERKGTIRFEPPRDGEPVTFNIESIDITGLPQRGVPLNALVASDIEIKFECQPYGLLDPVTWFTNLWLDGPIDDVVLSGVPGNVDGQIELTIADGSTKAREHIEVAIERDYDSSLDEPLLATLGSFLDVSGTDGASTTRSGSYAANVARATLTRSPVTVCHLSFLEHSGKWKIRCRHYPTSDDIWLRFAWFVGADGDISEEQWVRVPGANDFYNVDLATIDIPQLDSDHAWKGYVQAYVDDATSRVLDIDALTLLPAGNWGCARAPLTHQTPLLFDLRDDFDQVVTGGSDPLNGKSLPNTGTWDSNDGDATDAEIEDTGHTLRRVATLDTNTYPTAWLAVAGSNVTNGGVQTDLTQDVGGAAESGVLLRYSNANNFLVAWMVLRANLDPAFAVVKVVSGTPTTLKATEPQVWAVGGATGSPYYRMRLEAYDNGHFALWAHLRDAKPVLIFEGYDVDLATGALTTGKRGLFDWNYTSEACTRTFDNFKTYVPQRRVVLNSGSSMLVKSDKATRMSSAGAQPVKVPLFQGRYPTVPPATQEGRKSRLVVTGRRLDIDSGLPDQGLTDGLRVSALVHPRVLLLGRGQGGS